MTSIIKNPEYFLTIANECSISKAAAKLYVSQSYLSQHILKLEKELDVQLFDRSTNPIKLTEAGRLYKQYLEQNQRLYSKFTNDLDVINEQRIYSLNIGFATWRGTTLLPDVLPTFIEEYPNVRIHLHEHPVKELYTLVEKNAVDLCILNASIAYADRVTTEILAYEKILLVANKNNPQTEKIREIIERDSSSFDLDLLKDECFVLIKPEFACAEWVNNYMSHHNFEPSKQIITTSKTTAVNLVAENIGFCFLPEAGTDRIAKSSDLEFFDLKSQDLISPLAAVYKKGVTMSAAARRFIDITRDYYSAKLGPTNVGKFSKNGHNDS